MGPSANYKKKLKTAEEIAAEEEFNRRLIEADNQLKGITADPSAPLNTTPVPPVETPEENIRRATTGTFGGFEYPREAPKVEIPSDSPFNRILGGAPMEPPRDVKSLPVKEVQVEEPPMAPMQGPSRPVTTDPTVTNAVTPAAPATAQKLGPISGLFEKLGADSEEKRSALGTSLIKMGASMMSPNGMNFWGSLGQGLTDATTGYDAAMKQQKTPLRNKWFSTEPSVQRRKRQQLKRLIERSRPSMRQQMVNLYQWLTSSVWRHCLPIAVVTAKHKTSRLRHVFGRSIFKG